MNRVLPWISGLAAVVLTASGEYALYCACGFDHHVAAAGPVCLDAYLLAAIWARREVFLAMLVMVATNATAHLLPPAGPPHAVVVAVSALAPVVLWRVHELTGHTRPATPAPPVAETVTAVTTKESPVHGRGDQRPHVATGTLSSANDVRDDHLTAAPGVERVTVTPSDHQPDDHALSTSAAGRPHEPQDFAGFTLNPADDHRGYHLGDQARDHLAVMSPVISTTYGGAEGDHQGDRRGDHRDDQNAAPVAVTSPVMSPGPDDHHRARPDDQLDGPVMTDAQTLRAARRLHTAALKSTGRPVTIATLRNELDLSRRDAAVVRRDVIGTHR